jgi:type 1 glutamine amidotransferase
MKRTVLSVIAALGFALVLVDNSHAAPRKGGPSDEQVAIMKAAMPKQASAKPKKPRKMLVLSYQSHNHGRFAGEKALELMAEQTKAFELTFVRNTKDMAAIMIPEKLKEFDAVCVNNSTGGSGKAANGKTLVENLSDYVSAGGGLVGIHSATDNKFGEVFGGFFTGHPWSGKVAVKIDDPDHRLTKVFGGKGFPISDEIYQFAKIYTREKLRILLTLDMDIVKKRGKRADNDNAIAWVRKYGKGKVFYCSLGHNPKIFLEPKLLQFYLDGIQFALGDLEADTTPSGPLKTSGAGMADPKKLLKDGYVSMFNGKDMAGWIVPKGDTGHWKALDGVIDYDASSEAKGSKNLVSKDKYGNYKLHIEWRFKRTSGLYPMPTILPDGSHKKDANGKVIITRKPNADSGIFPRGYGKAQMNLWCWDCGSGEMYGIRLDKRLSAEVRAGAVPKVNADNPVGQWNAFDITVTGDRVTAVLNGKTVLENSQMPGIADEGPIVLQHHGGPIGKTGKFSPASSLVQFRNIYIKRLK